LAELIGKEGTKKDLASKQAAVVKQLKEFNGCDADMQWVFHAIDESVRILRTGFQDTNLTERDVDMHFLKPFFDNLLTEVHLHFGEGESRASRYRRAIDGGVGDHFDWLFTSYSIRPDDVRGLELGVAENSGPQQQELMDKARSEFVKATKGGRDQLAQVIRIVMREYGSEALPDNFIVAIKALYIIVMQVIGFHLDVYVVYFVGGNIFAVSEVGSARIPHSLEAIHEALGMCGLLLRAKALIIRSKKIISALLKEARRSARTKDLDLENDSLEPIIADLRTPIKNRVKNVCVEEFGNTKRLLFVKEIGSEKRALS